MTVACERPPSSEARTKRRHTCTHARTHAHTRTRMHTHIEALMQHSTASTYISLSPTDLFQPSLPVLATLLSGLSLSRFSLSPTLPHLSLAPSAPPPPGSFVSRNPLTTRSVLTQPSFLLRLTGANSLISAHSPRFALLPRQRPIRLQHLRSDQSACNTSAAANQTATAPQDSDRSTGLRPHPSRSS